MKEFNLKYRDLVGKLISSDVLMRKILLSVLIVFLIAISFPFIGIVELNMFPSPDSEDITIDLTMPHGTPIDKTNSMIKEVEDYLIEDNNVILFCL